MPKVNTGTQKTPSFTSETVTAIIRVTTDRLYRMFFILCAAAGLRFGEALGIDIRNISKDRFNTAMWSFGRTLFSRGTNDTVTRHPMFSQFCPAEPNSVGLGHSQQYDLAIPMAAILVSTNEKIRSPGATSRIDS
jgi:hypothetical protein